MSLYFRVWTKTLSNKFKPYWTVDFYHLFYDCLCPFFEWFFVMYFLTTPSIDPSTGHSNIYFTLEVFVLPTEYIRFFMAISVDRRYTLVCIHIWFDKWKSFKGNMNSFWTKDATHRNTMRLRSADYCDRVNIQILWVLIRMRYRILVAVVTIIMLTYVSVWL